MFFTVEGIEGSGKSTLLGSLSDRLRARGFEIFATREPGGTPIGDTIRALFLERSVEIAPLTEALLVNAARAQHVADRIRPELAAGRIVLCDRFVDSTLAYQGYGRGVDLALLQELCDAATGGLAPALTLLCDVPLETSRSRTRSRGLPADRLESEDDAFHRRVRDGFLDLARGDRYCVLDGTLAPEEVLERALRAVDARLAGRVKA